MQKLGMSLFAVALSFAALACDDGAIDKSEQAVRCQRVCNRVKDCVGSDFDSTDCRKECVDKSSNDDFQGEVQDCDECLNNDNSCAENTAKCGVTCASTVPAFAPAGQ